MRPPLRARLQGALIGAGIVFIFFSFFGLPSPEKSAIQQALEPLVAFTQRCSATTAPKDPGPTLLFKSCGGFAQERVSLMMGLTIGWLMNRSVVWPSVHLHTVPDIDLPRMVATSNGVSHEVLLVHLKSHPPAFFRLLAIKHLQEPHLDFDCAFLSLDASTDLEVARFMWHMSDALLPSPRVAEATAQLISAAKVGGCHLTMVAANSDRSWNQHCLVHDKRGDCVANASRASRLLLDAGISKSQRVLIANTNDANAHRFGDALLHFTTVSTRAVLAQYSLEVVAAAEYFTAQSASVYVGHSDVLASSLVLMKRLDSWKPVMWHNAGGLPAALPSLRLIQRRYAPLPWVVYVTQQAAQDSAQLLQLRRAVNSALESAAVQPNCIYDGLADDAVVSWLQDRGVRVLLISSSSLPSPSSSASPAISSPWPLILGDSPAMSSLGAPLRDEFSLLLTAFTVLHRDSMLREEEAFLVTSPAVMFRSVLTLAGLGSHSAALACAPTNVDALAGRLYPSFECDPSVMLLRPSLMHGNEFKNMKSALRVQTEAITAQQAPLLAVRLLSAGFSNALSSLPVAWAWKPYWGGHYTDALLVHFGGAGGAVSYASPSRVSADSGDGAVVALCAAHRVACDHWSSIWRSIPTV